MHISSKWIAAASAVVLTAAFARPAANTVEVSISGPGVVKPNVLCNWEGVVTTTAGDYTLAWTGGTSGSTHNDRYFAYTPASGTFYITVTATDSDNNTDTSTKAVRVSSTAGGCPL